MSVLNYESDFFNFDIGNVQYTCEVRAVAGYYCYPITRYYKDVEGDFVGRVDKSERLEIEHLEIKNVKDVDNNIVSLTDEMEEAVRDKLYDMDLVDWNGYSIEEETES